MSNNIFIDKIPDVLDQERPAQDWMGLAVGARICLGLLADGHSEEDIEGALENFQGAITSLADE